MPKSYLIFFTFLTSYTLIFQPIMPKTLNDREFLEQKLNEYNLHISPKEFSYLYETEINSNTLEHSFELDRTIKEFAEKKYAYLNNSVLFDISFITNSAKVRAYQTKKKNYKNNVATLMEFITEDNVTIHSTYFNRNSDKLMVIGPGFTNEREKMAPFAHMFSNCDLIFFDYRGHGYQESTLLKPSTWNLDIIYNFFGIDPEKTRLGLDEEKDVIAVINGMKALKKYKTIAGLGICYSALIFVKTAALYPDSFTHLILDGCWNSLKSVTEKMSHDLRILCTPQRGGWRSLWFTSQKWGRDLLKSTTQALFNIRFEAVSVMDFLPQITDIPILFFQGKNDLMVSRQEFEIMWNATKTIHKTAIITSNPHVWNHLKQKELYTLIVHDLFLSLPHSEFIACLQDKDRLIMWQTNDMIKP